MPHAKRKVNANPTKEFFVSMLVKDLLLKQAIIELIDNSIDGARTIRNCDYKGLYIHVKFNGTEFSIEDNCSGISLDLAQNSAFRFGRPKTHKTLDRETTGIFGIGMKRALFKMGNYFEITSATKDESFKIELDVEEWVSDQNQEWDFPFSEYHENQTNQQTGTKILVRNLNKEIKSEFKDPAFEKELIEHIERRVGLSMSYNLEITVNEKQLKGNNVKIIDTEGVHPIIKEYKDTGVYVKIICGIAAREGTKYAPENAGWYIYCNERLIVAADKTSLTTWKDMENKNSGVLFHNDYAPFRGIVFFNSNSPELMPWNTTKTSIDETSHLYLRARENMQEASKAVRIFLDEVRQNAAQSDDGIKETIAQMESIEINAKNAKSILPAKKELSISNIKVKTNPYVTISYKKPKEEVDQVKKVLAVKSNKAVGEKTFDYYVDAEV